jgi:uncharacterized protein
MLLEGVVTNVAAFGAFVDVGVHQDGLVHVSAMSSKFVSDPREVVKPGDVVRVKVLDVDEARKRISLTLRLDDEVGAKPQRGGDQRGGERRGPRGEQRGRGAGDQRGGRRGDGGGRGGAGGRGGSAGAPANSAMADALRRAGLTGDRKG